MKYTLLEIVQNILSDMNSDEVDSISETTESQQIAKIVEETYYYLISNSKLPEIQGIFQLTETDNTTPVQMSLPSNVLSLETLKYDKKASGATNVLFEDVYYLPFVQFYERQTGLNTGDTAVSSFSLTDTSQTHIIKYQNDRHPSFWTSFDDQTILFDSLDTGIDTYLLATKTWCYGQVEPTFTVSDSFIPNLDEKDFNWFLNEAKAACFVKLKQTQDPISDRRARRGWITKDKRQQRLPDNHKAYSKVNNFGRKR